MDETEMQELKKELWDAPVEENQWGVLQSMREWNRDLNFDDQPPENAKIYVRKTPPPGAVEIYHGETGERDEDRESGFNDMADTDFDPGMQPFLFSSIAKRDGYVKLGKLDDKSKAMLKEKYNVDVDAPDTEEDDG